MNSDNRDEEAGDEQSRSVGRKHSLAEMTEFFTYLDDLRSSGETNMYGAGAYLRDDFDLPRKEASEIHTLWMKTFDGTSSLEDRARKATGA